MRGLCCVALVTERAAAPFIDLFEIACEACLNDQKCACESETSQLFIKNIYYENVCSAFNTK